MHARISSLILANIPLLSPKRNFYKFHLVNSEADNRRKEELISKILSSTINESFIDYLKTFTICVVQNNAMKRRQSI